MTIDGAVLSCDRYHLYIYLHLTIEMVSHPSNKTVLDVIITPHTYTSLDIGHYDVSEHGVGVDVDVDMSPTKASLSSTSLLL